ncbi:carbonic anhydrase [Nocardiopsis composta]|uniref:carbonic anhydrase n=1 Tax=Nocardiopsis composta TaxID=157465 RepID=A0A7W8VDY0_9ACTN|nr:carbonic anhydrase [Nocardiopsis composta]MBB5432520.1 carbonic anhydrase [Nocardiopsis composta]
MAISRRSALAASLAGGAGLLFGGGLGSAPARADTAAGGAAGPDEALRLLEEGNERWRNHAQTHPNEGRERRQELLDGQEPFALVLGCADSRVPAELVFDRGLGDLFDVRSAGQVLDSSVLGSVVYGVHHLHVPLIVVLGHASCGAVTAAVEVHRGAPMPDGHIGYLVERILPVVDSVPDDGGDGFIDACITANARYIADELAADPELSGAVGSGDLRIAPARYELDSSKVNFLD